MVFVHFLGDEMEKEKLTHIQPKPSHYPSVVFSDNSPIQLELVERIDHLRIQVSLTFTGS